MADHSLGLARIDNAFGAGAANQPTELPSECVVRAGNFRAGVQVSVARTGRVV